MAPASKLEKIVSTAVPTERPHLLEHELARRWRLSVRTLQRWRAAGSGPLFLSLGRRIVYPIVEVERFEAERLGGDRRP